MPSTRSGKNARPSAALEHSRPSRNTRLRSNRAQNSDFNQAENPSTNISSNHSAANKRKRRASSDHRGSLEAEESVTTTTATENPLLHINTANRVANEPSIIETTNANDTSAQTSQEPLDDHPTISNYSLHENLRKWPKSRCKEVLAAMRPNANKQISAVVKAEIIASFQHWEHLKLMICLAGNITMRMFNQEIGNIAPTRKPSKYLNYLQFSKLNHTEPMPQPQANESGEIDDLVERNKRVGNSWTELSADEQEVFTTRLLLALAGIPDYHSEAVVGDGTDDENGGIVGVQNHEVTILSTEEEAQYRPLYNRLVAHDVVVLKLGTAVAGVSDAQFNRRSLQCIQKINEDMNIKAHRHEFSYWLVAASTLPPITPGVPGWCKVFTSIPVMTKFVTAKANFPAVFGAVAQGKSILNAVSQVAGVKLIAPQSKSHLTDKEKQRCRTVLLDLLVKTIGKKPRQGLPQGENPQEIFIQRGIPARLELDEGASLTKAELKLGFLKMNAEGRRKWMKDVANNKFRFLYDDSKLADGITKSCAKPRKASKRTNKRTTKFDSKDTSEDSNSDDDDHFEDRSDLSEEEFSHSEDSQSDQELRQRKQGNDFGEDLDINKGEENENEHDSGEISDESDADED